MSRPSEAEIREALNAVAGDSSPWALRILREAVKPREVWPAKEVAAELGVTSANLGGVKGLPAPAQKLPRPTVTYPDQEMSLWYVDEIVAFAPEYKARESVRKRRESKERGG